MEVFEVWYFRLGTYRRLSFLQAVRCCDVAQDIRLKSMLTVKVRIMRVLTGAGCFKEIGEERYAHNALSLTLANPRSLITVKFLYETFPSVSSVCAY